MSARSNTISAPGRRVPREQHHQADAVLTYETGVFKFSDALGDDQVDKVVLFIRNSKGETKLQLQGYLWERALTRLVGSIREPSIISRLTLDSIDFGAERLSHLLLFLGRFPLLQTLTLSRTQRNRLDASDVVRLCDAIRLSNPLLCHLDLEKNPIGAKSDPENRTSAALNSLFSLQLKSLSLWQTKMDSRAADTIRQCLSRNASITKLNLTHNLIGDIGAQYLAVALHFNRTLRYLNLTYNRITQVGRLLLYAPLKHGHNSVSRRVILNDKLVQETLEQTRSDALSRSAQQLQEIGDTMSVWLDINDEINLPTLPSNIPEILFMDSDQADDAFPDRVTPAIHQLTSARAAVMEASHRSDHHDVLEQAVRARGLAEANLVTAVNNDLPRLTKIQRNKRSAIEELRKSVDSPILDPVPAGPFHVLVPHVAERLPFAKDNCQRIEDLSSQLIEVKLHAVGQMADLLASLQRAVDLQKQLDALDYTKDEVESISRKSVVIAGSMLTQLSSEVRACEDLEAEWKLMVAEIDSNKALKNSLEGKLASLTQLDEEIDLLLQDRIACQGRIEYFRIKRQQKQEEDKKKELSGILRKLSQLESQKRQLMLELLSLRKAFPELTSQLRESFEHMDDFIAHSRSLQDYAERTAIKSNVFRAKDPSGRVCILKSFTMDPMDKSDKVQTEIQILRKLGRLKNPLIVPIELVFFEEPLGYIQMPFYEGGDLKDWLSTPRSTDAIRRVLQLLCHAVCVIHREGIVHRDIKLENVAMKDEKTPVLIDFGVSKDASLSTKSWTLVGTHEYIAPEILLSKPYGFPSDMYSLGVLIYKCFFKDGFIPQEGQVKLPRHDDAHLLDLLSKLLHTEAKERLTCDEVIVHPFFTAPAESMLAAEGSFHDAARKMAAVKDLCSFIRSAKEVDIFLSVRRQHVVQDAIEKLSRHVGTPVTLHVSFNGEKGIDAGGLTSSLYRVFFEQMLDPVHKIFVKREGSSVYLPTPEASCLTLRVIGYVIAHCLVDGRPASIPFASSVWRFLLDLPLNPSDLEAVDEQLFRMYKRLIAFPAAGCGLTVDDIDPQGDATPITDANKHAVVQSAINRVLVQSIRPQLNSLKEGFYSIDNLAPLLKLLSVSDLKTLLCGDELLTTDSVIDELQFAGFPNGSHTPSFLHQWMRSVPIQMVRSFLVFVTEMPYVPVHGFLAHDGSTRKIIIQCRGSVDKLPVSHTCALQLDLPPYETYVALNDKLTKALQETSFAMF